LPRLRDGEAREGRLERVRNPDLRRHPRRDPDRPVDSRRDHAVDPLSTGQPLDPALVLGRDDRAAIGKGEAGRGRVAVDRDHVQAALARCLEQPQLRRARA
jgi:hypothetical protein